MMYRTRQRLRCKWLAFICLVFSMPVAFAQAESHKIQWQQLPSVPDHLGLAGPFAGVSGGALIVGGGANFPGAMPWDGGQKVWHDAIYVLLQPNGKWLTGFRLPHPLGYGVSASVQDGVLCAGGSDAHQHFKDVFLLTWRGGKIVMKNFPPLPSPIANACGALVKNVFYIAGGTAAPTATNALNIFLALDLNEPTPQWRHLDPWPGPGRMLAVAGADDKSFYLFSGVSLSGDTKGNPVRHYLKDAYRYTPGLGWKQLADLPRAAVAAPSPAILHENQLLIVSGDDGELVNFEPKSAHPGFPKTILAYDVLANRWTNDLSSPISRATVPVTFWENMFVIPNGEARPGYRTPEVWGTKAP